jgi:hypothetical protein
MEKINSYDIDKDYELLKEVTAMIADSPLREWANNYLNGHLKHYSHVISEVLSLSRNNSIHRVLKLVQFLAIFQPF